MLEDFEGNFQFGREGRRSIRSIGWLHGGRRGGPWNDGIRWRSSRLFLVPSIFFVEICVRRYLNKQPKHQGQLN